mgnify:CR=1 FL=1
MTRPSVKATDALEKPPAAKPLRSRWPSDDDPKPTVDNGYEKAPSCFSISGMASLDR